MSEDVFLVAERVKRGADWLDAVLPEWWRTFDLNRFDLASGCNCVVGQLSGHAFDDVVSHQRSAGWFDLSYDLAEELGFYAGPAELVPHEYQALEDEWRRVIAERRS